ncbi:MAG: Flp pilus assembly protein CpaB [Xylophilus ampelinus]
MLQFTRVAAAVLVLLGLLLGVLAWRLARAPDRAPPAAAGAVPAEAVGRPVVVAARTLRAGMPVAADDLRIERLTIASAAASQDPSALVGRIPVADLPEGMPLAPALFAAGLAQRLEEGERAIAVHVDETIGVGHQVRPGDFVDVHLVLKRDGEIDQSQARLLMARNRVLAYGTASVDGPAGAPGASAGGGRQEAARTVVLAVPADRVGQLALAESSGRLFLALRRPQEDGAAVAEATAAASAPRRAGPAPAGPTLRELAGLPAAPAAPPALAGAVPVVSAPPLSVRPAARTAGGAGDGAGRRIEIIRGVVRETLSY